MQVPRLRVPPGRERWLDLAFGVLLGVVLVAARTPLLGTGSQGHRDVRQPRGLPFIATMPVDVLIVVGIVGWEEMVFRGILSRTSLRVSPAESRHQVGDGGRGPVPRRSSGGLTPATWTPRRRASSTLPSSAPVRRRVRADRRTGSSARSALRLGLYRGVRVRRSPDRRRWARSGGGGGDAGARLDGVARLVRGRAGSHGDVRPGVRADPRVGPVPARHPRGAAVCDTGTGVRGGPVSGQGGGHVAGARRSRTTLLFAHTQMRK